MSRTWPGMLALGVLSVTACEQEPEALPPLGAALIVIDTDAPVPRLVGNVRLDLYRPDGTWFYSETISRAEPITWPVSFGIVNPSETEASTILVRVRGFADNKVRDYRGERFIEPVAADAQPDACLSPDVTENLRLIVEDDAGEPLDLTPLEEPLPRTSIDALAEVNLAPGIAGRASIFLAGDCFGREVDLLGRRTCVSGEYAPVERMELEPDTTTPSTTQIGTWPPGDRTCGQTPPTASEGLFDDQVCVDGGAFLLGDPGSFGFGVFDAFPEAVAVLPPLFVDRYEVTVGRFRQALASGLLDAVAPPRINDGTYADAPTVNASENCTFSTDPRGREEFPLNCVSWDTARAFCRAAGGDLPTEAQWEWIAAAAERPRQTRFPFGDDAPSCGAVVYSRVPDALSETLECFPDERWGPSRVDFGSDETASGVVGMGGNVREWTLDEHHPYCGSCWDAAPLEDPRCTGLGGDVRTVRGGDWTSPVELLRAGARNEGFAAAIDDADGVRVGFRCVYPVPVDPIE
ncbi:MAG: formylglycine-generating enzyme family protein [Myxococcota bacterium]